MLKFASDFTYRSEFGKLVLANLTTPRHCSGLGLVNQSRDPPEQSSLPASALCYLPLSNPFGACLGIFSTLQRSFARRNDHPLSALATSQTVPCQVAWPLTYRSWGPRSLVGGLPDCESSLVSRPKEFGDRIQRASSLSLIFPFSSLTLTSPTPPFELPAHPTNQPVTNHLRATSSSSQIIFVLRDFLQLANI